MLKWRTEDGDITTINLMSNTHLANAYKQKLKQAKEDPEDEDLIRTSLILEHEINLRLQLGINIPKTLYLPNELEESEYGETWTEHFWSMDN